MKKSLFLIILILSSVLFASCSKKTAVPPASEPGRGDIEKEIEGIAFHREDLYQDNMFDKDTIQVGERIANMTVAGKEVDEAGNISVHFAGEQILSGNAYFVYDKLDELWIVTFYPDIYSLSVLPRMIGDFKNIWFVLMTDFAYTAFGPPGFVFSDGSPEAVQITGPTPEQVLRTKATIKIDSFIAKSAPRDYNSAYLMEVAAKEAQETLEKPADFEINFYEHVVLLEVPDRYTAIARIITDRKEDGTGILGDRVILNYSEGMTIPDEYIGKELLFFGNVTRISPLTVFIPQSDMWRSMDGEGWTPEPLGITTNDLRVNGVQCGDDGLKVIEWFGDPISKGERTVHEAYGPGAVLIWDTWLYNGIEFVFYTPGEKGKPGPDVPQHVQSIRITGSDYPTNRGIRVGDSIEKVLEVYGPGRHTSEASVVFCTGELLECVEIVMKNSIVAEIKLIANLP